MSLSKYELQRLNGNMDSESCDPYSAAIGGVNPDKF